MINNKNNLELVKFEDGDFNLNVSVSPNEETVWLTVKQIAALFERDEKTIRKHIDNSLSEECCGSTVAKIEKVQLEGNRIVKRLVPHYDLEVITSVGYRVKSQRGILFRKWANKILKEYLLKGSVFDEKRCLICESNILELQNNYDKIMKRLDDSNSIYSKNEMIFFEGENIESYTFIRNIFFLAKKELIIIDNYADKLVLSMLNDIKVKTTIITNTSSYIKKCDNYSNITIIYSSSLHGRYIIADDFIYLLDNSFNNIGKKKLIIVRLYDINKDYLLKDIIK